MLTTSAIRRWRLPVLPVRRRDRDWYIDGTRGDFDTSCARLSRVAPLSVGAAVAKFAAAGLVALLVLIVSSGMMLRRSGTREAVNNARSLAGFVTRGIAEPNLTDELINGNQMALARFDRMMRKEALKKPIRRIKLWTTSGRIAYSDIRSPVSPRSRMPSPQTTSSASRRCGRETPCSASVPSSTAR